MGCHLPGHLAPSHSTMAVMEVGTVANDAEFKKRQKYAHLTSFHYFVPIAVETLGVFGREARSFLKELGQHLNVSSGDPLAHQYLVQHILVALQRRNVAAVLGCAGLRDKG